MILIWILQLKDYLILQQNNIYLQNFYSRICLNLNSKYGTNVKKTILEKCKMYYRNYNNNKNSVENDTLSVEDKQIKLTKLKYKFIGIFHFVGELYK